MAKKTVKNLKAGVFIFIGLALLISYLVVIGGYQSLFMSINKYNLMLKNAGGLFQGSYVTINGMRVGNVYSITLEDDKVLVSIGVKKRFEKFVNQSSIAKVKTKGLLGDKYVSIDTKTTAPVLPKGSFIKTEYLEGESNSKEEDLLESVTTLVKEASSFISHLNQEGEQHLAEELRAISQKTQKLLSEDNSKNVTDILIHLKSILKKIDEGQGTLGAVVNERTLHKRALGFLGGKPYKGVLNYIFRGSSKKSSSNKNVKNDEEF